MCRRAITLALPLGVLAWAAPPARATDAPAQQQPLSTFEPMSPLQGKDYGKPRMRYSDFATTACERGCNACSATSRIALPDPRA